MSKFQKLTNFNFKVKG